MADSANENKAGDVEQGSSSGGAMGLLTNDLVPVLGTFVAATIVLVALLVDGNGVENFAYGVALSTIAMFFALVRAGLALKGGSDELTSKAGMFLGHFLFVWCFIGTCILTFDGPYTFTGNGYFASWAMTIFAVQAAGVTASAMASAVQGLGALLLFWVSSLVVLVSVCVWDNGFDGAYKENLIYSLILACVTLLVVGFLHYTKETAGGPVIFYTMVCFSIMWIVQAALVTFDGPFKLTGNGYFGSWAAAITSIFAAVAARGGASSS